MTGLVDDFSLLVELQDPEDLHAHPRYRPDVNPRQSRLVEVLAPYNFGAPYRCGLSSCHMPHQSGYLVLTDDDIETNIGWRCGKRYFGDSFSIKANLQDKRARLKRQLDTLQGVLDRKEELLVRISELYDRKTGTRWANSQLRSLKDNIIRLPMPKLYIMATRGETAVVDVREATGAEKEQHKALNPGAKPLEYMTEKIGDLQGLGFLAANPHQAATDLKNLIYELERTDVKALSAKKRLDWVNWAIEIERAYDSIEERLADAVKFFSHENMRLIYAFGDIEDRRAR